MKGIKIMATKLQHLRKKYVYDNGEEGRSAKPNWVKLVFECLGPKGEDDETAPVVETYTVERDKLSDDIMACAFGHGISQKMGDDIAGIAKKAKAENVEYDETRGYADFIVERLTAMAENFAAGVWVAEGESASGSGSVTILLEAIVRAFGKAGTELSEDQIAGVRANLKNTEWRDAVKARADVAAEVAAINAERAAQRAAKAQEKLANAEGQSDLASLIG